MSNVDTSFVNESAQLLSDYYQVAPTAPGKVTNKAVVPNAAFALNVNVLVTKVTPNVFIDAIRAIELRVPKTGRYYVSRIFTNPKPEGTTLIFEISTVPTIN